MASSEAFNSISRSLSSGIWSVPCTNGFWLSFAVDTAKKSTSSCELRVPTIRAQEREMGATG